MDFKPSQTSEIPVHGSYTPIDNLVKQKGSSRMMSRLPAILLALLIITLPIIGYNVYQSQSGTGQATSAGPFCGQSIPYQIIPPGTQLGSNQCKQKTPVCYECRHGSGQIEFFGCCGQESPTPTPPQQNALCPYECVPKEAAVFCSPESVINASCPAVGQVCCKPVPPTPTVPIRLTPTPTPPKECILPQVKVTISCPTCDIFTKE